MSNLDILITDTVDVFRLTRVGDKESYGLTPVITGLRCQILPASNDILAVYPDIPAYQLYEIYFFKNTLVKNGDKLKSGSIEYILRGVPQAVDNKYMTYQRLVGEKVV